MHLYLIRHGQTELGKRFHFQYPETQLSAAGRAQASVAGVFLEKVPFTKVYTSTFMRARETAELIVDARDVVPEPHEFFEEKVNLSSGYGRSYFSVPFVRLAYATIVGLCMPNYRAGDEETMRDLMKRAEYAKVFLETHPDAHVVVVSHSLFMSALLDTIHASRLPAFFRVIRIIIRSVFIKNAQLFHLYYAKDTGWKKIP